MAAAIGRQLGDRMPIKREEEAERELAVKAKERGAQKKTHTDIRQGQPAEKQTLAASGWLAVSRAILVAFSAGGTEYRVPSASHTNQSSEKSPKACRGYKRASLDRSFRISLPTKIAERADSFVYLGLVSGLVV